MRRKYGALVTLGLLALSPLLGGIVGISMACAGYGMWSLVGQQLIGGAVNVLLLWCASDWRR